MPFRTEINLSANPILDYKNPILHMGSCFSENIGEKQAERKDWLLSKLATMEN